MWVNGQTDRLIVHWLERVGWIAQRLARRTRTKTISHFFGKTVIVGCWLLHSELKQQVTTSAQIIISPTVQGNHPRQKTSGRPTRQQTRAKNNGLLTAPFSSIKKSSISTRCAFGTTNHNNNGTASQFLRRLPCTNNSNIFLPSYSNIKEERRSSILAPHIVILFLPHASTLVYGPQ